LVEDAEDISSMMVELLADEGFDVASVPSGRRALAHLRSAPAVPGLILLDLMMPDMDGCEFRAEQKKDPRLAGIPVLLMTAAADPQAKVAELGVQGLLKKPFKDIESIVHAISRFF
jgi:CheY-like chemotaxis protein